MKNKIQDLSRQLFDETVQTRRHLHRYPELSFKEFATTDYLTQKIEALGLPVFSQFSETGLLTKIEKGNAGKRSILLRSDMDALPIVEKNHIDYCSENNGVMHACGHDVHMASLLSAIKILLQQDFNGTIWCLFQPAEEKLPGGAKQMIDNGLLDFVKPDFVIAQHTLPNLEAGKIGVHAGYYMASTDEFYLTIKGKGGHAALPHEITDTVLLTSELIVKLQKIVSHFVPASIPTVLSFGKIVANGTTNVIPSEVKIEGTFRTMSEEWRIKTHDKITNIIDLTTQEFGADYDLEIRHGYPVLYNNPDAVAQFKEHAQHYLDAKNVLDLDIRMTAEDFAYFSQEVPSILYRIGTGNKDKGITHPLHSDAFNIDESVLEFSPGLMAFAAIGFLEK